ncbi:unnamed protein product [Spirodela intermedia]|uniref:Uncharacterized protein n=1 Tax=Spirodela intermedia TaxID=51605 RepID=A0A7I8I9Z9_SPIIN|nr:unnamed protein product [Spirodela intermedia]CAA6654274.1 unnamed protein product [Spirodela intermedia]
MNTGATHNFICNKLQEELSLPVSEFHSYGTVMGNGHTMKFGHYIPLKHSFTANDIAQIYTKKIVKLHGIPNLL